MGVRGMWRCSGSVIEGEESNSGACNGILDP